MRYNGPDGTLTRDRHQSVHPHTSREGFLTRPWRSIHPEVDRETRRRGLKSDLSVFTVRQSDLGWDQSPERQSARRDRRSREIKPYDSDRGLRRGEYRATEWTRCRRRTPEEVHVPCPGHNVFSNFSVVSSPCSTDQRFEQKKTEK